MFWSPFPLPPSVSPPLCLLAYDIWLPAHPPISKSANPPCPKSDSFFFWEGGVNSRKVLGNLWSVCFRCLLISSGSSLCNLEIKTWMTLDAVAAQLITWVHANTHTQRGKASTSINLCVHARARTRAHGPTGPRAILTWNLRGTFCLASTNYDTPPPHISQSRDEMFIHELDHKGTFTGRCTRTHTHTHTHTFFSPTPHHHLHHISQSCHLITRSQLPQGE